MLRRLSKVSNLLYCTYRLQHSSICVTCQENYTSYRRKYELVVSEVRSGERRRPELRSNGSSPGPGRLCSRTVSSLACSVVVLVGAGLFLRTLSNLLAIDPGFSPRNVLVAQFELPMSKYDKEHSEEFYRRLLERLRGYPVWKVSLRPIIRPSAELSA
jgi:hypothetical protein